MKRPIPKELIVEIDPSGAPLHITTHSQDAEDFIEKEASNFGELRLNKIGISKYFLFPHKGYNIEDILAFLEAYNQPEIESHPEKPPSYKPVIIALINDDYTTGHWAEPANRWIGYAFNQSPPTYKLSDGAVTGWMEIKFGINPRPLPLMAELRQALLDNAPPAWRTDGELDALAGQMETDEAVLRVAIHFIIGTGKFIRQGK